MYKKAKTKIRLPEKECSLLIKRDDNYFDFARVWQGNDESLYCSFINLNNECKGRFQKISGEIVEPGTIKASIVEEKTIDTKVELNPRISYHTTGMVKYHGFSVKSQKFEPLYKITKPNLFFLLSIAKTETLKKVECSENDNASSIILDISDFNVCDILFSIVPANFADNLDVNISGFVIEYALFGLFIEFIEDSRLFKYETVGEPYRIAKMIPHLGMDDYTSVNKKEAFLKYKHVLYGTNEGIILPPDEAGTINVIFGVEMRKPPWIKIEFANKELKVLKKDVKRDSTNVSFKVRDKSGAVIKDANKIPILSLLLDAEIYDDESAPPEGYF